MKFKTIVTILTIILIGLLIFIGYQYRDDLYIFYRDNILKERSNLVIERNNYARKEDFLFVQITDDFIAKSEKDVRNIIYTVLDSGSPSFTFYCDDNYYGCLDYVDKISNDSTLLSEINNFVSPYNSYQSLNITYNTTGKITLNITKNYTEDDIKITENVINQIIVSNININDTKENKIIDIHNYIINNGEYKINDNEKNYSKASDILINGYGSCNSYADAMALFLDRFGIKNYRISSENHIWNLLTIDEENYLHLDLTWDDPVTPDGSNYLQTNYLLITDNRLKEQDQKEHNYNPNIYLELKS